MTFKDGFVAMNYEMHSLISPEKPRQHNSYGNETIISKCIIHIGPQPYVQKYKANIKRTSITQVTKSIYKNKNAL